MKSFFIIPEAYLSVIELTQEQINTSNNSNNNNIKAKLVKACPILSITDVQIHKYVIIIGHKAPSVTR
jgi:hypothetical protein